MKIFRTFLSTLLLLTLVLPVGARADIVGYAAPATGEPIELEVNEGQLLRLEESAVSVFVANPEIANVNVKSPQLIYVFGQATGETTLFAVDSNDNVIANLTLSVSHNLSRLRTALDAVAPRAQITAVSIDGGIILGGTANTATEAANAVRVTTRFVNNPEEIINQIQVTAPNQINLRVRVAEVSKEVLEQFGFDWSAIADGAFNFGLFTNTSRILADASPSFFSAAGTPGPLDLNVLIDALADDELVTVLAEPNLTALSGETASFLAGGEFPVPVGAETNDAGGRDITIEFKEFGVSLAFTPTLIGENLISMRVRPEVSQLSQNGAVTIADLVIPALATRRAETTVELGSGQSFAIAGLLLDDTQQLTSKVPGLGDIPILGQLFTSDRFQRSESELVIIVTPYLVRPVSQPLPLPTDAYVESNQTDGTAAQTQVGGTASSLTLPATSSSAAELPRPLGFILE
ncbi:type II and III secretion system protein family protein [Pelagibius sp. Alg239-R121]|uniref:type II and III secretion system protein family protein n=1 Tax=Pelagibius sp. Alg239-R121 TaxID=2993448 RepID=UPI0024A612D1|nr:type II and III secretion system protein family protein [Pelagibius sp. Alg239-R121]